MKKIAVFVLMCVVFAMGVFAEAAEYEIRISHDETNNCIVAGIYISKGNSVAGHFGISYNGSKLQPIACDGSDIPADIPEKNAAGASYLTSVVKGGSDYIIVTPEMVPVKDLINKEKSFVLFGWYAHKDVDSVKAGECVAQIFFKTAQGVKAEDITVSDIIPVSKSSTSALTGWSGGIMVADASKATYFYEPATGASKLEINVVSSIKADEKTQEAPTEAPKEDIAAEDNKTDSTDENKEDTSGTATLPESVVAEEKQDTTLASTDLGMTVKAYSDKIRIVWEKPTGFTVTQYKIIITDKDNYPVRTINGITENTRSLTVRDLAQDYTFKVSLAAIKPDGTAVYHQNVAVLKTERSTTASAHIYNVQYKAGQGSLYGMESEQVVFGNHPTKAPTVYAPDGYKFAGWSLDGKNVASLEELKIYSDTQLTAVYTKAE